MDMGHMFPGLTVSKMVEEDLRVIYHTDNINRVSFGREKGVHLRPLGYAEKKLNDTILCLCENSPRFHQIASIKGPKIKIY